MEVFQLGLYLVQRQNQTAASANSPLGLNGACMSAHSADVPDSRSYHTLWNVSTQLCWNPKPTWDDNKSKS